MKLQKDIVSVILPVYNAEAHLAECLTSLKKQTYRNLQIIAIDDKSRDSSYQILKKFKKRMKNLKVLRNKKHYGLAICYNRALKRSNGQFITFMNQNDINNSDRIRKQINFLINNPKTAAVGTQYSRINEEGVKLGKIVYPVAHSDLYNSLLHSRTIRPETFMLNRMLLPKDLLYFYPNRYSHLFKEIFIKLFSYGNVTATGQSLYYHRILTKKRKSKKNSLVNKAQDELTLWLKSLTDHDYRPSIRSLFPPLIRGI